MEASNMFIFQVVNMIFQFLMFVMMMYNMVCFVWILSSWIPVDRSILPLRFVDNLINPVYFTLLRFLPSLRIGVMDFSPFYLFISLMLVENLITYAHRLTILLLLQIFG